LRLPFEIVAGAHLAKAEEYWLADRLSEAHAAMSLALNTGIAPSDVYDRQRTIDAELAARIRGARHRIAEHLEIEAAELGPALRDRLRKSALSSWLGVTETLQVRWGKPVLVTVFADADASLFMHARYGYYRERTEVHKVCLPPGLLSAPDVLVQAMRHEVTHAALHDVAGDAVPRWLDEGVAVWMEGGGSPLERRQLRIAAGKGRLPTMDEVTSTLESYGTDLDSLAAGVSYAAAGAFVSHVALGASPAIVVEALRRTRSGYDLARAFRKLTGLDLRRMEAEWRREFQTGST